MVDNTIDIDGVTLHYRRSGEGSRAIILMHGWGCNMDAMSIFERVGAEKHTVYNLDMPGFGTSSEPPFPWGIEDYTHMLEDFVKAMGIGSPILIGHSFGGRVAILYASRNDVNRLILVDAAGVRPRRSPVYYAKVYSFKLARKIYPYLMGRAKAEKVIAEMRARRGSYDYNNCSDMMRRVMVRVVNADLRHAMPHIKAPTLLMWGEDDSATPLRDARIMKKLIPDAGLVTFPGAGHFSFIDNPYQSAATVRRFIHPDL